MKNQIQNTKCQILKQGFTLIEVSVALVILGMIAATILVVVNRAIDTVVMWQTKMDAFEIVRENMEKLLSQKSVTDMVEYGIDANNPDINWETTVESFYEPISSNMWMRAVCTAEFTDASGEKQKVEFTHWLTGLNKKQVSQIIEQQQRESQYQNEMNESPDQQQEQKPPEGPTEEQNQPKSSLNDWLGLPPPPYKSWEDQSMPADVFWKANTSLPKTLACSWEISIISKIHRSICLRL